MNDRTYIYEASNQRNEIQESLNAVRNIDIQQENFDYKCFTKMA